MVKLNKSSTVKKAPKAKPKGYAKGGSTVNAAGNYTKPTMRKRIFNSVKAQLVAARYKKAGGGYTS